LAHDGLEHVGVVGEEQQLGHGGQHDEGV
jgi:hypothetical protein